MRKLRLLCAPVLACVLLGATIAPASVGASSLPATPIVLDSSLKIHPLLQAEAQIDPTRVVRVIVQQVQPPSSGFLGNLVGGLLGGGSNNGDEQFTIIPALVTSVQLGSIAAMESPRCRPSDCKPRLNWLTPANKSAWVIWRPSASTTARSFG